MELIQNHANLYCKWLGKAQVYHFGKDQRLVTWQRLSWHKQSFATWSCLESNRRVAMTSQFPRPQLLSIDLPPDWRELHQWEIQRRLKFPMLQQQIELHAFGLESVRWFSISKKYTDLHCRLYCRTTSSEDLHSSMLRARGGLLSQATSQTPLQGTESISTKGQSHLLKILTSPIDLMAKVQVPINLRITNPPKTVLISGIPLCFANGANSFTRMLAVTANRT